MVDSFVPSARRAVWGVAALVREVGELISAGMGLLEIPQLVVGALAVALMAGAAEIGFGWAERLASRRLGLA